MISSKPFQYKQGWVEFYKLKFKLTPDVLIPRPETELLVDEVLNAIDCVAIAPRNDITILDLGTGSGCIAISLAKNLSFHPKGVRLKIIATDISSKALKIAHQNAKLHGVLNKIEFIQSDLLSGFDSSLITCHLSLVIVANLPYIPTGRISQLDSSVKDFEPHLALDGGKDGFDLYRKLFQQIRTKNLNVKYLICEIDDTHSKLAKEAAEKYFPQAKIGIKKDLSQKVRILLISL